ncbi:MAG TPA: cation:proton antiporter [Phycisphaerales bacterium]|nr:cation:proton antiporter [Phycisphaerales bacterium]
MPPAHLTLAQHGGGGHSTAVLELMIVLGAAAAVTMLVRRLHMATIPAYLITGALLGLVGPWLGLVPSPENIGAVSNLAVIMLMFTIGLHLDLDAIRAGMLHILLVGVASTILVLLVCWPTAMLFGTSGPAALVIAMAMSMSSTAVVFRILQQRRQMNSAHGRVCFAVLVVQDLLALAFLAMLAPVAAWARAGAPAGHDAAPAASALELLRGAGAGIAGIALLILVGRVVLPRLVAEAARESSGEVPLILSAAVALGAALITSSLGMSPELGAFLAGFLLASTPFRHQLSGQLAPLRDLFMAVFFTSVGLRMDLSVILSASWVIGLGLLALVLIKGMLIGLTTWTAGSTAPTAVASGLALAQAGEFSLVLLGVAAGSEHALIDQRTYAILIGLVGLSLILTPTLYNLGQALRPRLEHLPTAGWITSAALRPDAPEAVVRGPGGHPLAHHVIIAGFGVVGRNLAQHFEAAGIPYVIVELNPATVRKQKALNRAIVFGDISNIEVLESAGVERANAVVLTLPDDEATLRATRAIRARNPSVFIAARASYLSRAIRATELGADHVVVEEIATAEAMSKQVVQRIFQHLREQPEAWIPGGPPTNRAGEAEPPGAAAHERPGAGPGRD